MVTTVTDVLMWGVWLAWSLVLLRAVKREFLLGVLFFALTETIILAWEVIVAPSMILFVLMMGCALLSWLLARRFPRGVLEPLWALSRREGQPIAYADTSAENASARPVDIEDQLAAGGVCRRRDTPASPRRLRELTQDPAESFFLDRLEVGLSLLGRSVGGMEEALRFTASDRADDYGQFTEEIRQHEWFMDGRVVKWKAQCVNALREAFRDEMASLPVDQKRARATIWVNMGNSLGRCRRAFLADTVYTWIEAYGQSEVQSIFAQVE